MAVLWKHNTAFFLPLTMNPFLSHFASAHGIVIGVIHFPPLPGNEGAPPLETALENALRDLRAFEGGGVDAVIIENNYDLPHRIKVLPETKEAMISLGNSVRRETKLPIGVCVLWNDYETSFAVAKAIGAQFIRIPVLVDDIETDFGSIQGDAPSVMAARTELGAQDIQILADIHVKHARIVSKMTIAESAALAISSGADGVIVTGKWTGDPPDAKDMESVRSAIGDAPILAGSGASADNARDILKYANGMIVSTSLKEGVNDTAERNVKKWQQRISLELVRAFVDAAKAA